MSNESDEEVIGKNPWTLLSYLISKIGDVIILQGFFYALLLIIVSMRYGKIDKSVFSSIIILYLLNTLAYILIRDVREKETEAKNVESIKWKVKHPLFFPSPFYLLKNASGISRISFPFDFRITNNTKDNIKGIVYVKSKTQAVGFVMDEKITVWKRHYFIIPRRTTQRLSLDNSIELEIPPDQDALFSFTGWYRPIYALDEYSLNRKITLYFRLVGDPGWLSNNIDTKLQRIDIPFRDEMPWKKDD